MRGSRPDDEGNPRRRSHARPPENNHGRLARSLRWTKRHGADVVKKAIEQGHTGFDGRLEFVNEDLREALLTVAGRGGAINSRALGSWLSANKSRIVDSARFEHFGTRQGAAVWALVTD